jgi:hypothetical protein
MNIQELATEQGVELLAFYNGVALCKRGHGVHPFVSWRFDQHGFYWGHYSTDRDEADQEFKERIEKH